MDNTFVRTALISEDLRAYIADSTTPPDKVQEELRQATHERTDFERGQIGHDEAVFIEELVRAVGARRAVEVGTFTGYSAISIARGLGPDGHLLCCDIREDWSTIAREFWEKAGVAAQIDLRIAPAIETLNALNDNEQFDFAFIDADKPGYISYYEALMPHIRTNGVILADNTLQAMQGNITDTANQRAGAIAIRAFNEHVRNDNRVSCVVLSIGDGVSMIQKL